MRNNTTCPNPPATGIDIRDLTTEMLCILVNERLERQSLSTDSIYNNILSARPDATETEVMEAAERAMVLDFAWELPDGMHTRVGKDGKALSIDDKQHIFMARAFLFSQTRLQLPAF